MLTVNNILYIYDARRAMRKDKNSFQIVPEVLTAQRLTTIFEAFFRPVYQTMFLRSAFRNGGCANQYLRLKIEQKREFETEMKQLIPKRRRV